MDLNEMNENWQEHAPTLAAMEKTNPFSVPDGYFEEMQQQLHSRIRISQLDDNETFFKVPDNYFETLEDKLKSISKLEELKGSSHSEMLSVPEGYFDTLEQRIKAKLGSEELNAVPTKIRRLRSNWITYAAAACITAIISFGIYFNTQNNTIEAQMAKLPANEIVDYLQLYTDAGDAPMIINSIGAEVDISEIGSEASEQEIEQYLKLNL
jgi:hypothetical protein